MEFAVAKMRERYETHKQQIRAKVEVANANVNKLATDIANATLFSTVAAEHTLATVKTKTRIVAAQVSEELQRMNKNVLLVVSCGLVRVGLNFPMNGTCADVYAHVAAVRVHVWRTLCSVCATGARVAQSFPSNS